MLKTICRSEVNFRELLKVKHENYSYPPPHMKAAFLEVVM
jgi:hypothetical protein